MESSEEQEYEEEIVETVLCEDCEKEAQMLRERWQELCIKLLFL